MDEIERAIKRNLEPVTKQLEQINGALFEGNEKMGQTSLFKRTRALEEHQRACDRRAELAISRLEELEAEHQEDKVAFTKLQTKVEGLVQTDRDRLSWTRGAKWVVGGILALLATFGFGIWQVIRFLVSIQERLGG